MQKEAATTSHTIWRCDFFNDIKKATDEVLHSIPFEYMHECIRCGIAPAMKMQGKATFWGKELGDNISEKAKRLLGYDDELHKPGENAERTEDRQEAFTIIDQPERGYKNARQTFLMHKWGPWNRRRNGNTD